MRIRNRLPYVSGGLYGQLGNVYAIQHDEGCVLIDAGTPDAFDTIVRNLRYWGIDPHDVTHVFCTHGHDDHAGSVKKFQNLGSKIIVGKPDAYMLEQGNFGPSSPFLNHQMPCCTPDCLLEGDTHWSIGGVSIDAYAMPGHTDGSYLYVAGVDEDTILFTGDMFFCDGERGDVAKTGWQGDMSYNSMRLGDSFARLWSLGLSPTVVLGGHGNPRIGTDANSQIMIAYKYYLLNNR